MTRTAKARPFPVRLTSLLLVGFTTLSLVLASLSGGCRPAPLALTPGDHTGTVADGQSQRSYVLHVPPGYDGSEATPLVLVFHGAYGGSGEPGQAMAELTGFSRLADTEGFLVVYPNDVSDLTMAWALLAQLRNDLNVDYHRIYVVGYSNGGFFVHYLVSRLPGQFAAVATVAATMDVSVGLSLVLDRHTPIMLVNGTADTIFPWDGIPGMAMSVPDTVGIWVRANLIITDPYVTFLPDQADDGTRVKSELWFYRGHGPEDPSQNPTTPREVLLYTVEGGGHSWPGSAVGSSDQGPVCQDFDCTRAIWDFFERHPGESVPE